MEIRRWEFHAFAIQAFLLGVTGFVVATVAGRQVTTLPQHIWFGVGMLLLMLSGIPIESVYFRARLGRELPLGQSIAFSFLGAVVGAIVYRLTQ